MISPLAFAQAIASGAMRVIDLTQTLAPDFPIIALPPELGQCAPFRLEEISRYDERGPAWYWNNFSTGEHTGTHFDAPIHWVSGKDLPNNAVDTIDPQKFIAPAAVIDCSARMQRRSGFPAHRAVRRGLGGEARRNRARKLGAAAHRLVEETARRICGPARGRRTYARARRPKW